MDPEVIDEKPKKKRLSLLHIALIQGAVIIFTMSGVCSKTAGGSEFPSFNFILFYGLEMCVLAVYALLWQQIIKRVDLSVAYVNRSTALMWSMIWAAVIFGETINVKNIVGVLLVIAGTVIVNGEAHE